MCSYCGCRSIGPIGRLSIEHVQIRNLSGDIRRRVAAGEPERAAALLEDLKTLLDRHDAVEELSLYPAMARHEEYADKVDTLFDEHDGVDMTIDDTRETIRTRGADAADWPALFAALDVLVEHIQREENGLFPAAAIALGTDDWRHAESVRASVEGREQSGP